MEGGGTMSKIMTMDQEWSHEELYGVAYDECAKACQGLKYLLDMKDLDKPNILLDLIMEELDSLNLVDCYDAVYIQKAPHEDSDIVFSRYDEWMQKRIQDTLLAHKYKGYIGGK